MTLVYLFLLDVGRDVEEFFSVDGGHDRNPDVFRGKTRQIGVDHLASVPRNGKSPAEARKHRQDTRRSRSRHRILQGESYLGYCVTTWNAISL